MRVQEDHPGRDHHCGRGRGADRVLSGPQVWPRAVRCRGDERPRDSVAPRITPASPQRPLPRWVAQQAASSRTRGMAGMSLAARVDRAGFPQQRRCWKESGSGGLPLTAVTISVSLAERDIAVCEVRRSRSMAAPVAQRCGGHHDPDNPIDHLRENHDTAQAGPPVAHDIPVTLDPHNSAAPPQDQFTCTQDVASSCRDCDDVS